jgi:hypothetical protein
MDFHTTWCHNCTLRPGLTPIVGTPPGIGNALGGSRATIQGV